MSLSELYQLTIRKELRFIRRRMVFSIWETFRNILSSSFSRSRLARSEEAEPWKGKGRISTWSSQLCTRGAKQTMINISIFLLILFSVQCQLAGGTLHQIILQDIFKASHLTSWHSNNVGDYFILHFRNAVSCHQTDLLRTAGWTMGTPEPGWGLAGGSGWEDLHEKRLAWWI